MTTRFRCGGSDLVVTESFLLGPRNRVIPYIVQGPRFWHGMASKAAAVREAKRYGAIGVWRLKR